MATQHYKPYEREGKKWGYYKDETIKNEPDVAVLSLNWIDQEKKYVACLYLRYFWYKKNKLPVILDNNDDLEIVFEIMPYENYIHPFY